MQKRWDFSEAVKCSSFATEQGAEEYYLIMTTSETRSFTKAIAELYQSYRSALQQLDLSEQTRAFCRFYLSDVANQKKLLVASEFMRRVRHGAVSVIQQNPLGRNSIIAFAYHIKEKAGVLEQEILSDNNDPWPTAVAIKGANYSMIWNSNLVGTGPLDSKLQSERLFKVFSDRLSRLSLSVRQNLIRTWIYVRDIDNHYAGMVEARREFFQEQGLSQDTRFVASTGIEGRTDKAGTLVTMDSIALGNIRDEQIMAINAPEYLSPTILYGVTFERGLRVRFGDRSHLYISGTASIDKYGHILHEGDVERQAQRALDNVAALLGSQNATLEDIAYAVCYVRNRKHWECVKEIVTARLSEKTPLIAVEASVCRPGWLFEMEAMATIPDTAPFPNFI